MNILSYIHIHRLPNPSGVGRVMDQLISAHVSRYPEHSHSMLVQEGMYKEAFDQLTPFWQQMPVVTFPKPMSRQQAEWVFLNRPDLSRFSTDAELVYCPAESYVPTKKAALVCTIHDVAGFEEELYPRTRHQKLHCWKWGRMFKQMARHCGAVTTVSEFSAGRIAHFFPELKPLLKVVYNAPHVLFGAEPEAPEKKWVSDCTGGAPYVLVPGGLSLRKNADLIIRAWPGLHQRHPELKLVIAGSSKPEYLDRLTSAAGQVVPAGYVSDGQLNALYHAARTVWFPSKYEGFGMPVIEAMKCSTPVVASDAASIPEIVGDAALLCAADSEGEHIEAVSSVVSSNQLHASLSQKGLERAGRFSWDASAEALEQVFQSAG